MKGFTIKVPAPGIKDQLPIATGLLTILEVLGGMGVAEAASESASSRGDRPVTLTTSSQ
jgi:hypothetical protein